MELWVREVIRDTKVRRETRVTAVCLVLLDCLAGQDLWVPKVSLSWDLMDLLVLWASLELLGLDDLAPEGPLALLDPQDLHLAMDQMPVSLAPPVPKARQDLQEMPTR